MQSFRFVCALSTIYFFVILLYLYQSYVDMPFAVGAVVYTHPTTLINEGWLEKDICDYIVDGVVECTITG